MNIDDLPEPDSEIAQEVVKLLNGQPFPFAFVICQGYNPNGQSRFYWEANTHGNSPHADGLVNSMRHLADELEDTYE